MLVSCECPCGRRPSVETVNVEAKRADFTTVRCECGLAYTIEDDGGQLWLAPAGGGRRALATNRCGVDWVEEMLTPAQSESTGDPPGSWRHGIPSLAASTRRWQPGSSQAKSFIAESDEAFAQRRQAAAERGLL